MIYPPSTDSHSVTRRGFLTASIGGAVSLIPSGHATRVRQAGTTGVVWTQRGNERETEESWTAIAPGAEEPFILCGHDVGASARTLIRTTDQWGRRQSQRRGPEWGTGAFELVSHDDGYLLTGVDGSAPLLIEFPDPSAPVFLVPEWRRTYDGTTTGPVHATATDDGHAIGWMDADETAGIVIGTDRSGVEQWTAQLEQGRELVTLLPAPSSAVSVAAIGSQDGASGGWATVWATDGTREQDQSLETPGEGPHAVTTDGSTLVLAGRTDDGFWLQGRSSDWTVEWSQTFAGQRDSRGVDDVVARKDGYGLLAHDSGGALVIRTDEAGTEQWRGLYAPYSDEDEESRAIRGNAMIPVEGDEFVVAGTTAPGAEGRDWWVARVGEPGVATPADIPEPTPTSTPHEPLTRTPTPPTTDTPPSGGTATSKPTTPPTPTATSKPTETPGSTGPGFGLLAGLAGVGGWLLTLCRDQ